MGTDYTECLKCNGTGFVETTCRHCDGEGCARCEYSGSIADPCEACRETGWVRVAHPAATRAALED